MSAMYSKNGIIINKNGTTGVATIKSEDGTVKVDTTELPNGVQYDLSVNTDIIATKESVANKKDRQNELTFDGSATKTVKKITQNANGELNVEFEDIDVAGGGGVSYPTSIYGLGDWSHRTGAQRDVAIQKSFHGNRNWLLDWRPYLVDYTTAEGEIRKKPSAQLKKNNWLRKVEALPIISLWLATNCCIGTMQPLYLFLKISMILALYLSLLHFGNTVNPTCQI